MTAAGKTSTVPGKDYVKEQMSEFGMIHFAKDVGELNCTDFEKVAFFVKMMVIAKVVW
jgi:hypothetical protein